MSATGPGYGFGLYVHWPYCARICPYCDFNVYAAKDRDTAPLVDAVCADIEAHRARLPEHPALDSVFLGGGTPSLLSGADMSRIIETARDSFGLRSEAEITLEANPNDVLKQDPIAWQDAGINRLSLGIQSFDDRALSFLGRDHDSAQARTAIEQVQPHFDNLSIDLIYARPGQSTVDWADELSQALDFGAPHLSLYELTIEARTAFGKRAERGELVPMPDDDQADLYELTQTLCEARGLAAYEVSNHARSREYQSRHNHIYWASGDWIGVGPGAHGRLTRNGTRIATEAARRPEAYLEAPAPTETVLTPTDSARELLAMALRPLEGLDLSRLQALTGSRPELALIDELAQHDLVALKEDRLILLPQGRLLADYIAKRLSP